MSGPGRAARDELVPEPHVIVVFGAAGDLARRMLLPSLWHLHRERWLPADWRLLGVATEALTDAQFHDRLAASIDEFGKGEPEGPEWEEFRSRTSYLSAEVGPGKAGSLADAVASAEEKLGGAPRRLFYLAVPPPAFGPITAGLAEAGVTGRARVIYEKPFGEDLDSFTRLEAEVLAVLRPEQMYTIDHFLAKEALQNILALRFANGIFEPVWNRHHIDHVQIDVPETLSVGTRGGFYERTGALRDMVVTHLFQALAVIAMEPPARLAAKPLFDEKAKVFDSMDVLDVRDVVYGQYEGYTATPGVAADSATETFVAAKVRVDNWRWAGVPFYLRTGKRMPEARQLVTLAFRRPPMRIFEQSGWQDWQRDSLTVDMKGDEGVALGFLAKRPGPRITLGPAQMTFAYSRSFGSELVGPYERLLHDALLGDRTLFTRADALARTWEIVQPVLDDPPKPEPYAQGSWGPAGADALIAPRRWHLPLDRLDDIAP